MAILFNCLSSTSPPEIISYSYARVSVAQVVKVLAPGSVPSTVFERGFDSCMWLIFFQDEGGEIANCKTYVKNVIVALSRNAPIIIRCPEVNAQKFSYG